MHAKYEVSISNGSKVIANVKVDNRQTDRQTNRQDKNNMPPIIRSGGIKIDINKLLPGCDYSLDSVYSDYPKSSFPQKLKNKKSSTEKAKSVHYERIDEYK